MCVTYKGATGHARVTWRSTHSTSTATPHRVASPLTEPLFSKVSALPDLLKRKAFQINFEKFATFTSHILNINCQTTLRGQPHDGTLTVDIRKSQRTTICYYTERLLRWLLRNSSWEILHIKCNTTLCAQTLHGTLTVDILKSQHTTKFTIQKGFSNDCREIRNFHGKPAQKSAHYHICYREWLQKRDVRNFHWYPNPRELCELLKKILKGISLLLWCSAYGSALTFNFMNPYLNQWAIHMYICIYVYTYLCIYIYICM